MHTLEELLTHAQQAVKLAEEVTMHYYRADEATLWAQVKLEDDRFDQAHHKSIVTLADQASERTIKKYLHEQFPDHGFIWEEYGKWSPRCRLRASYRSDRWH